MFGGDTSKTHPLTKTRNKASGLYYSLKKVHENFVTNKRTEGLLGAEEIVSVSVLI